MSSSPSSPFESSSDPHSGSSSGSAAGRPGDGAPKGRKYACRRVTASPQIDGTLGDAAWTSLPWSEEFVDITGDPGRAPRFRTRFKMGWDDECLYVGADLEEPHVWGTLREMHSRLYEDNDFELFLDPDGDGRDYYELEVNALETRWELFLPRPYREGGRAVSPFEIPGLRVAVSVRGTVNDPRDVDEGWSVAIALPWSGLARIRNGVSTPPRSGEVWRANFSRVQWRHEIVDDAYRRVPPHGTPWPTGQAHEYEHQEDNWVWSPQGVVNMHIPDRWGEIVFS